ncbi:MAG TPA: glycosyltransferase, partial [Polyangiaceae bacterium]|nr:glycosyltransferase [Polyangiaceae bacterium]
MREPQSALRVLARPAFSNRGENPYNWLLYTGLSRLGVQVDEYGIGRSLVGRYDICHVHWPESTFNSSLIEALATTESLLCSLDALRARGTRVVWTVHNLRAHERRFPRAERAFFDRFVRRVDAFVALSRGSRELAQSTFPALESRPGFIVPHPHYRSEYPDGVARSQARVRLTLSQDEHVLLFFGRVLEYKNVLELIRFVRALPPVVAGKKLCLVVAGRPHGARLERAIYEAAASDPRVRLHL